MKPIQPRSQPESCRWGDLSGEVHRLETRDGQELAVSRIFSKGEGHRPFPVILVHGTYCTRTFWISPKGVGMGAYLAGQGFDVWVPDMRGHGLSPKTAAYSRINAEDQIRFDLPAIQEHVFRITGKPAFWIGHSFGGLYTVAALGMQWLRHDLVKAVVTFGSQISHGDRYLKIPPVVWIVSLLMKMLGHLPAPRLGLGPEIEPAGVILETIRWKKWRGEWTASDGRSYWDGLGGIKTPVMTVAAADDKNDPAEGCLQFHERYGSRDKAFVVLGIKEGFRKDYDHVGMVVSKEAQVEVWPKVASWLMEREKTS
ncbi:MAG: alpha/beta fold hydrolase [Thermodesulfobacteriota bacterium]